MADNTPLPQTADDQLARLADYVKENGDDLKIKVSRRSNPNSAATELVAILRGGKLRHVTEAETWLVKLSGGGTYTLQVFGNERLLAVVQIPPIRAEPTIANPAILQTADWTGPDVLLYPTPSELEMLKPKTGLEARGAAVMPPLVPQITPGVGQTSALAQESYQLAQRERDLLERTHKADLEAVRRESDAQVKRLEAKLADIAMRPAPEPARGLDIPQLVAALAPLALQFVKMNQDMELRRMEADQRRADEAAKRPMIDPAVQALIDKSVNQAQEQSKIMSQLFDGVGVMARNMVQMVTTVSDLQLGQKQAQQPQEEQGINLPGLLKAVMEGIATIVASKNPQPPAVQQPQLPPAQLGTPPEPTNQVEAPPVEEEDDTLDQFKDALLQKMDKKTVVDAFITAAKTEKSVKDICQNQMALLGWITSALGETWLADETNMKYIMEVGADLQVREAELMAAVKST